MSLSDAMKKFTLLRAEPEEAPDVDDDPELRGTEPEDIDQPMQQPTSLTAFDQSPLRGRDTLPISESTEGLELSQFNKGTRNIDRTAHRAMSLGTAPQFSDMTVDQPKSLRSSSLSVSAAITASNDPLGASNSLSTSGSNSPLSGSNVKSVVMISGSLVEIDDNYRA